MNKNVSSCKRPCDLVKTRARKITRCRILLLADGPNGKTDQEISDALGICLATIFNIRRHYHEEGLERAIGEGARSGQPPKFKGKENYGDCLQHSAGWSGAVESALVGRSCH